MNELIFNNKRIAQLKTKSQLLKLLDKKGVNYDKVLERIEYTSELEKLQLELLKFQKWALTNKKKESSLFLKAGMRLVKEEQ